MTATEQKEKESVVYSSRRKRSLHCKRLMDIDKAVNPNILPPGTPIAVYSYRFPPKPAEETPT